MKTLNELSKQADELYAKFLREQEERLAEEAKTMKEFNELFEMYNNGDNIYLDLFAGVDFNELYSECDKHLAKYEQFKRWLKYSEEYYNKNMAEITAFLEEV